MKRIARVTIILLATLFVMVLLAGRASSILQPDLLGWRLLNAASDGSIPRTRLLLLLGADINYANGFGTALHYAASRGDTALMELLLDHGANANYPAKWEETPLYRARQSNQSDAERILLAHGANPNTSHINPP